MDPFADMGCVLKVNVHGEACKMKMMEVLSSINGVYSVSIDSQSGTAKVSGEVDPNILLMHWRQRGITQSWSGVKLKHSRLNRGYHGSYGFGSTVDDGLYTYGTGLYRHPWYDIHEPYRHRHRHRHRRRQWWDIRGAAPCTVKGCVLKVNVHCDACKMEMVEVLSAINGVYSLTIDAQEGTARIAGEVDRNILLGALARSGRHAELVRVNLKHPALREAIITTRIILHMIIIIVHMDMVVMVIAMLQMAPTVTAMFRTIKEFLKLTGSSDPDATMLHLPVTKS
ncbi:hypothetical protein RJ639_012813 [Escallonia herrerae]|uniref:HMA domain-containing protein n=1 Tax=Escallonia herrerae TaxID=1293975 RepID=A0AA88VM49_9ASTE|nr:hypothetical protein RJ639_012813 [Escallonia herrerae]